jgi:hypothetical protein
MLPRLVALNTATRSLRRALVAAPPLVRANITSSRIRTPDGRLVGDERATFARLLERFLFD